MVDTELLLTFQSQYNSNADFYCGGTGSPMEASSGRRVAGVSIWRYGAKNSASKNFLVPKAVFSAPGDAASRKLCTV